MIVAGAGRHAKDLYVVLKDNEEDDTLFFFDDINEHHPKLFLNQFEIIKSEDILRNQLKENREFALGVGGVKARRVLFEKFSRLGGSVASIISKRALVGCDISSLGAGLNIMPFAFISESVKVGKGTLVNTRASIHHDVEIGDFCDIAPGSTLLGGVKVGNHTFVGAASTILPDIEIGSNCIIGAGSVVTKNVPDNSKVVGVPARIIGNNAHEEY